jgi:hypothetical protein
MKEYHKIDGIFAREEERPHRIIWGQYRNSTIESLKNIDWVFTEKVDGTNIRVHWDGHKVTFGGRTDNAQIPATLYQVLAQLFDGTANEQVFEQKFGGTPATLYGEGFGAKIQKGGGLYADKQKFILFDVNIDGIWLERENVEDIAKAFDIEIVPVVFRGNLEDAIAFAKVGFRSVIAEQEKDAEGMVGTPVCNVLERSGRRVVVKLKHEDLKEQTL